MRCPRCTLPLEAEKHAGINVERCPRCKGRWLDHDELEQLEETIDERDEWRAGTIEWAKHPSELPCPKCGETMRAFDYRGYEFQLDTCTQQHGYWLDAGEEQQVEDALEDRIKDLEDARDAEVAWGAFLYKMRKPSWLDRMNRFLRG
jgi:Zn-finger nucleic acid-binding protein